MNPGFGFLPGIEGWNLNMGTPTLFAGVAYPETSYLQKFRLYETRANFYMIGRDKARSFWKVLKIDKSESAELNVIEDSVTYSECECCDLLRRIHEGNKSNGGLKFVTTCYGIVGFIRFLGPYYMILITGRRKIGTICGHSIYAIVKKQMITITNTSVGSNVNIAKSENRYKKLLRAVNLTKDFFFSYSYHAMFTLQKNIVDDESGEAQYENMFVWNEFLTREFRTNIRNTRWTIPLVHGFFKQTKLSLAGRDVKLILIARRSRHYAGTRYLKRGVNENGRVANDVETEQIVYEEVPAGDPLPISSVVQNRGSIPLFWSQETSRLNIKPDIILSKKDRNYEATRLHFENLEKRYGNPIIILNLIKTREKKPREIILRAEFANAIRVVNKTLPEESRLRFLHWDLNKHSGEATNVLSLLGKVASYALNLTGIFFCEADPCHLSSRSANLPNIMASTEDVRIQAMIQKGVLRTNCIDCLDRTNVAQFAYGLVGLGLQLRALGVLDSAAIDLDNPLAEDLMAIYETMGDTLALQYGGSAAHNKIFCDRRGQWKAATQSQEFIRTLQRYYNNAYMDAEKQEAINLFLGHFKPQDGKPALWEVDSDHAIGRVMMKRSLSDGNLVCQSASIVPHDIMSEVQKPTSAGISESTPEIRSCESKLSYPTYPSSMSRRHLFLDLEEDAGLSEYDRICHNEHGDTCSCSNFVDLDWLSSSGNSCDDDRSDRSSENLAYELDGDAGRGLRGRASDQLPTGLSERFVNWVINGELMCL